MHILILFFKAFFLNWLHIALSLLKQCSQALSRLTLVQFVYITAALFMFGISLMPWLTYHLEFFKAEQKLASSLRWFFSLTACIAILLFFLDIAYKNLYALLVLLLNSAVYTWGVFSPGDVHNSIVTQGDYGFSVSHWLYGLALGLALLTSIPALRHSLFQAVRWKSYLLTRPML